MAARSCSLKLEQERPGRPPPNTRRTRDPSVRAWRLGVKGRRKTRMNSNKPGAGNGKKKRNRIKTVTGIVGKMLKKNGESQHMDRLAEGERPETHPEIRRWFEKPFKIAPRNEKSSITLGRHNERRLVREESSWVRKFGRLGHKGGPRRAAGMGFKRLIKGLHEKYPTSKRTKRQGKRTGKSKENGRGGRPRNH